MKYSIKAGNVIDCVNIEIPFKKNYTINISDNKILSIILDDKNKKMIKIRRADLLKLMPKNIE